MKGFRKSTRIAYWVLRALAISSALLLFSIIGIVALQPASHATGLVITVSTTTAGVTSSPADMTPTPTASSTPAPTATNTPTPTAQPTTPPTPTPTPTKTLVTKPTATRTVSTVTPTVVAIPTSAALGPVVPPTTLKGTPKVTPDPTPSGSPTPNPSTTPISTSSNGNAGNPSTTQQNSNGGMMATIKPLIVPIAGVSTTILLGSVGVLALMFWRKRTAAQGGVPSAQASGVWGTAQVYGTAQPTELAPAQNRSMSPFAMQSIVQYSPC